ncbi:MAG: hypothetical protein ACXWEY_11735 [Bacteroidia bacterium]
MWAPVKTKLCSACLDLGLLEKTEYGGCGKITVYPLKIQIVLLSAGRKYQEFLKSEALKRTLAPKNLQKCKKHPKKDLLV